MSKQEFEIYAKFIASRTPVNLDDRLEIKAPGKNPNMVAVFRVANAKFYVRSGCEQFIKIEILPIWVFDSMQKIHKQNIIQTWKNKIFGILKKAFSRKPHTTHSQTSKKSMK